jgi:hypothetical protein
VGGQLHRRTPVTHTIVSLAMTSCHSDNEVFEAKMVRAEHRAQSLYKKRVNYQRSLNAQPKPKPSSMLRMACRPSGPVHALAPVPHGAARTMTRTCLAKGLVAGSDDMPTT